LAHLVARRINYYLRHPPKLGLETARKSPSSIRLRWQAAAQQRILSSLSLLGTIPRLRQNEAAAADLEAVGAAKMQILRMAPHQEQSMHI
jgi:hypothetical protein